MKPIVGIFPFSKWITRLFLAFLFYIVYKDQLFTWQFNDIHYLIIFGLSIFSILLILGGLVRNSTLTIISAILLLIFGIIFLILESKDQISFIMSTISIVWGLLFISMGNRSTNMQKSR